MRNDTWDLWAFRYIGDIWLWVKKCPKTPFNFKVPLNIFISKIYLNLIADIVFDLRNEFHANRMKFGTWGTKRFLRQFWPILTPLVLKVENFGQNWCSRAEKLAYFCMGNPKKLVPRRSADPPDSSSGGFCWHCLLRWKLTMIWFCIQILYYSFNI